MTEVAQSSSTVQMVCHRGANRSAPENTLASTRAAFDLGADYVELDVRQSADGELVVIHDATLDRTTDGSGPVEALTMAEIARLDAGSWFNADFGGERVPTFADVLTGAQGRGGLYVEIKDADAAAVLAMTEQYGLLGQCFFWSEVPAVLEQLRDHSPEISLMIRHKDYDDLDAAIRRFRPNVLEYLESTVDAVEIQRCQKHGVRPMAFYPGRDVATFRRLADLGVVLFNLDEPAAFNRAFRSSL